MFSFLSRFKKFLLLLALGIGFCATSVWAQQERVVLPERTTTVGDALDCIRQQTRYRFAVNRTRLDMHRSVRLSSAEGSVGEILDQLLRGTDHAYTVNGRQVLIAYRKPAPVQQAEPQPEIPVSRDEIPALNPSSAKGKQQEPVAFYPIENRVAFPEPEPFRPMLAVSTNLLAWVGVMPDLHYYTVTPNIGAEYFFRRRWSVGADWSYAKWRAAGNDFWGISALNIEPRFWLANDGRFTGFYLGIYGTIGEFDVQNERIDLVGATGDLYGGGISLGYSIPFSERWGMLIGLRAGYRSSDFKAYSEKSPEYIYEYSATDSFWGITGIDVSLRYRFGKPRK